MGQTMFTEGMPLGAMLIKGLGVTLLGMGVVFMVLVVISLFLDLLRVFLSGGKQLKLSPEPAAPPDAAGRRLPIRSEEKEDDADLVAVIAAAVAAYADSSGDLRIRSVRPLDAPDPLWGRIGRMLQMAQRL